MTQPIGSVPAVINDRMKACIDQALGGGFGVREDLIPGARISRLDASEQAMACVMQPAAGVLLSGVKTLLTDQGSISYGAGMCFLIGLEQTGRFLFGRDAGGECLRSISVKLDAGTLRELMAAAPALKAEPGEFSGEQAGSYRVMPAPAGLVDAFSRLADLAMHPEDIPVMGPLIIREIHYRLLSSAFRGPLFSIFSQKGSVNRLAESIRWMTEHYNESFNLARIADMAHMSPATFNRHFRALMCESPLQYKRSVRLIMARRFIESERITADEAAGRVGYKSVSQFHRDFKKRFGFTPGEGSGGLRGTAE